MIDELPWVIQKQILAFDVKHDLHKDLLKQVRFYHEIKNLHIPNKYFLTFLRDCIRYSNLEEEKDIEWYTWILLKIFKGERPWRYVDPNYIVLISFLKMCHKRRFTNYRRYGVSILSIVNTCLHLL